MPLPHLDVDPYVGEQVWGGKAYCLVCCPGNELGGSMGEWCILSDQWNLCACKHEVFSCVLVGVGKLRSDKKKQSK